MNNQLFVKSIPLEELQDVIRLISIQKGALVERKLVENELLSISLFALDRNQELLIENGKEEAMVQVLEGHAAVTLPGKEEILAAGGISAIPAAASGRAKAVQPTKLLLTRTKNPERIAVEP